MTRADGSPGRAHPIALEMRRLRMQLPEASRSLSTREATTFIPAVVLGSYERGDRKVTLEQADKILAGYGKRLAVVDLNEPTGPPSRTKMAAMLRTVTWALEHGADVD